MTRPASSALIASLARYHSIPPAAQVACAELVVGHSRFARITRFTHATLAVAALLALAGTGTGAGAADAPLEKVTVRAVARFNFDRTAIDPQDQARLLAEVGAMKDVTWQTVTATGYTDSVGPAAYNASLAKRRATVVKSYLTGQGLPPTLVRTFGKGEQSPVADNSTEEGRAQNRRTEVVFEGVRAAATR